MSNYQQGAASDRKGQESWGGQRTGTGGREKKEQQAGMAKDGQGAGSNGQRASMSRREQAQMGKEYVGMCSGYLRALMPSQTGRQGPRNPWAWALCSICELGAAGRAHLFPTHNPERLQHPWAPG